MIQQGLYIGIFSGGTTSKMRAEQLKRLLPDFQISVVDTDVPFLNSHRLFRTLGFRYKLGPIINRINRFVLSNVPLARYDFIWVDKAVYLTEATTQVLKSKTDKLIHFTPDAAFYMNASRLFNQSARHYDFLVTTKSFELEKYHNLVAGKKVVLTTQGFDRSLHKSVNSFSEKKNQVVFVGLAEKSRTKVIQALIDNGIQVALAGLNWEKFAGKNKANSNLNYIGSEIRGKDYVALISESYFGLGLLSKRFPELHTTRTFEIPACGTALLTESTKEIEGIFSPDEVIYYDGINNLLEKIKYYQDQPQELERITSAGRIKVIAAGLSYEDLLFNVLETTGIAKTAIKL